MGIADDEAWMRAALELAEEAARIGEVPVGAVVVRDGEIIGRGYNQMIVANDPTAHAEIVALREAARHAENYRLPGASLYVSIEPCTMCAGAMIHARIASLFFAAPEPRAGAAGSSVDAFSNPGLNHRVQVTAGLCEAEGRALITEFFKTRRT